MKRIIFLPLLIMTLLILQNSDISYANNLTVSNVITTGHDVSAGTDNAANFVLVQFDISWDNSFRDVINWDAAWVFVKYKNTSGVWAHASINATGFTAPTGSTVLPASDGTGAYIYRDADGTGTFSKTAVQLRWNYGVDGVVDNQTVTVKVFAIEMVQVPTGSFVIGDGDGTNESTGSFHLGTTNTSVTIDATLTAGIKVDANSKDDNVIETIGLGIDGDGGLDIDADGIIDYPDFPTGYNAFYCMKYELTQGQYVDFLNTLTRTQQNTRTGTSLASGTTLVTGVYVMRNSSGITARNNIRCPATIHTSDPIVFFNDLDGDGIGNESNDGENIPCNYITVADLMAYADWAGLRPMSELEFEKACRGSGQASVYGEYSFGTTSLAASIYSINNSGMSSEGISTNYSTTSGNVLNDQTLGSFFGGTINGPVRVGIFAANASNSGRVTSGASYYGIMELSGNLAESCATVGKSAGRVFVANHGDGQLNSTGDFDVVSWPAKSGNASGMRGGYYYSSNQRCSVSDRNQALESFTTRIANRGGRLVRTAE